MSKAQPGGTPVTVMVPGDPASARAEDLWLEVSQSTQEQRSLAHRMRESLGLPAIWTRRLRFFSRTTLGMMTLITLILTVAILAAGVSMSQSTDRRQNALGNLISATEPMSTNAQDLFTSLSLADTVAATGFVQAGVEPPATRDRYQRAIQSATVAATEAAAGLSSQQSRELELIMEIQTQLPVYTGLVETARTNNRIGNPVGVAYMSEASSLMRLTILPAARELLDISNQRLNDEQRELTQPQWIPLSGLFAAVIMLLLAQRWLASRTRRRLNKGFLVATAFMTIALLWVVSTNAYTWYVGAKGYEEATAPLSSLADARVLAQQARTQETMALVRRETSNQSIEDFDRVIHKVNDELDSYSSSKLIERGDNRAEMDSITAAMSQWETLHSNLRRHLDQGEYEEATALSFQSKDGIATPGGTTAEEFNTVDSGLAKLMADARSSLHTYLNNSLRATRWVSTLVLILSIASVTAMWLGIRPRLQEYL
ncbi:phenol hydroxylase [Corynebacterium sp. H130]|uniref:phenol hydroxylase n=1 Tax=Corynebacterium sp. H130 TaxID=3133444 RepID=UPI003095C4D8